MTNCMHCKKSVSVGLVVCGECSDLIAQQQAHLKEAMELLGLAVGEVDYTYPCYNCAHRGGKPACTSRCESCEIACGCKECRNTSNFRWKYAERYETLKRQMAKDGHVDAADQRDQLDVELTGGTHGKKEPV